MLWDSDAMVFQTLQNEKTIVDSFGKICKKLCGNQSELNEKLKSLKINNWWSINEFKKKDFKNQKIQIW